MFWYSLFSSYLDYLMNYYNFWLLMVFVFVSLQMIGMFFFSFKKEIYNSEDVEIYLTLSSSIIILFLFFSGLSFMKEDKLNDIKMFINIIGNQWYWKYYFFNFLMLDSFLLNDNWFNFGRLMSNYFYFPVDFLILCSGSSSDVIHSWFLPKLNIKLECNPGFINYVFFQFNKIGFINGNCAEICGMNHSMMPVNFLILPKNYFMFFFYFYFKKNI